MTLVDKHRAEHKNKSEADLVILRESCHQGSVERQVVLSLLHEKQIHREEASHRKTRLIAWLALIVAALALVLQFLDSAHKSDTLKPDSSVPAAQPP